MTDLDTLNSIIRESGVKKSHLASLCGITRQGFSNKLNGRVKFNIDEVSIIMDALHLSMKQVCDIFLS